MVGEVDTRGMRGFNQPILDLDKGLNLAGVLSKRAPGSLRACMNVEIVDRILQTVTMPINIGTFALNYPGLDVWVLEGNVTADWTISGTDLSDGGAGVSVKWYKGSQGATGTPYENDDSFFPAGRGFIWKSTSSIPNSDHIYFITHTQGLSPSMFDYFAWSGGSLTLTDTYSAQFMQLGVPHQRGSLGDFSYRTLGAAREVHRIIQQPANVSLDGTYPAAVKPLGEGPVTGVMQTSDTVYAVRDYLKVRYTSGSAYIEPDTDIYLDDGATDPDATVYWQEITKGTVEYGDAEGWLYLTLGDDGKSSSPVLRSRWLSGTYPIKTVSGDVDVATSAAEVTYHGLLWENDVSAGGVGSGWTLGDMNWSGRFKEGTIAPVVADGPIFVTDQDESVGLDSDSWDSGWGTDLGGGDLAWSTVTTNPNLTSTGSGDVTNVLRVRFTPSNSVLLGRKPQNIYVRIKAATNATGWVIKRAWLQSVQETTPPRNPDSVTYLPPTSEERGNSTVIPNTSASYDSVYIGAAGNLDLWGLKTVTTDDDFIYLFLQFEDTDANTPYLDLNDFDMYFEYLPERQRVYFLDDATSTVYGNGYIHAYQVFDGDWSTDDARGWISISDLTTTLWPWPGGIKMYSSTSKYGTLYGTLEHIQRNCLPSHEQLLNAGTRTVSELTTMGSSTHEKLICTNGVSPAFAITEHGLSFIRLPVDEWRDRPTFLLPHRNHLVLGVDDHIVISSIGTYNNFSTYDGASAFKVGDKIAGLVGMTDNTVIIGCAQSIHRLSGSSASGQDAWQLSSINNRAGCLAYSMVLGDDLYMLDTMGLKTLVTSDKFGDFDGASLSGDVETWLRPRLQLRPKVVPKGFGASGRIIPGADTTDDTTYAVPPNSFMQMIPVRAKNQLRMFFADETIMHATIPSVTEQGPINFTTVNYGASLAWGSSAIRGSVIDGPLHGWTVATPGLYKATALNSTMTSDGEEWILMGTEYGEVLRLEAGTVPPSYVTFTTNPVSGDVSGNTALQQESITLVVEHEMGHSLAIVSGQDFKQPVLLTNALADADGDHKASDPLADTSIYTGERQIDRATVYQRMLSDGLSWAVMANGSSYGDYYGVLKFVALQPSFSARDSKKGYGQRGLNYGATKQSLQKEI